MTTREKEILHTAYLSACFHYRETCYNVQRTKVDHGPGEAYSRAVCLADEAQAMAKQLAHLTDNIADFDEFFHRTYANR